MHLAMASVAEALALGLELHQRGELARAAEVYRRILAKQPQHVVATHRLGLVTLQAGRAAEAIGLLERSVAADPAVVEHLANLAVAYRIVGRPADALNVFDRALALHADNPGAYYNRALALVDLGRPQEAVESYRRSLALNPHNAAALSNLGDLLRHLGPLDEALELLDRALAIDPNYVKARYNRSLVLLSLGRLREGFAEYEWRLRAAEFQPRSFEQPRWDGSPLDGRTLLVYCEQGYGDAFQFARYLPLVAGQTGRVVFELPAPMQPLFVEAGFENVVTADGPRAPFDVQAALLSLPYLLGTTLETIPARVPYLQVDACRVDAWRARLARYSGYKLGIVWHGRPTHPADRYRSIPLAALAPLAEVPGVRLFSLQKGAGTEQIPALQAELNIVDLGSQIASAAGDFRDTAAILANLDLVVSCDTACVHLAGGLGVPVWVALPYSAEWRWLAGRDDSPWYPTARLFRQTSFGDWTGVARTMADELRKHFNTQTN